MLWIIFSERLFLLQSLSEELTTTFLEKTAASGGQGEDEAGRPEGQVQAWRARVHHGPTPADTDHHPSTFSLVA